MRFTAIILALLLSAPTMAHQLKASVTTVLFNKRTNNIELMHRFYLHDTEHAVEHLFDGNADILSNKEDQKRFADYVESHIALQTLGGKPLELNRQDSTFMNHQGIIYTTHQSITESIQALFKNL